MEIQEQFRGKALVMEPAGRLDSLTCREFEARLLAALNGSGTVVVDCTKLEYISSAGLRVLLVAAKQNRTTGGRLALAALRDNLREVFDISGFSAIFAIHPTVEAAVASLA
ncbi:MAG TPA: STAS domain-containing protein [Candidatus Competibacter sp.]|nr:STAS domain-containing protein [Candidatus Competibacter sp.]